MAKQKNIILLLPKTLVQHFMKFCLIFFKEDNSRPGKGFQKKTKTENNKRIDQEAAMK